MSATLSDRNAHDTLVLPDAPSPMPGQEPPAPTGRHHRRRTTAFLIIAVAIVGGIVALLAFLFTSGDTGTDTPETPTTPAAATVEEPTVPEVPAPVITYGQELRANWDVTGIAASDVLDVRTGPGAHNPLLTTLPADMAELESTGRTARVDGVLWRELVIPGDGTGWVDARHTTETAPPPPAPGVTYGSEAPAFYDVTGVAAGDALNVRSGPGTTHPVVARLAPDASGIESTGRIARVDGALWRELALPGDGAGWASAAFMTPSPGAPQVVYGEEPRANWDVTGIAAGAVLDVHRGPGATTPVVAGLAADAAELESTGRIARVDGVQWRELVIPGDGTGWVEAAALTETPPPPQVVYGQEPPAQWDVTGVAADAVLDVHTGAGAHTPVLTTLPADATELQSTGLIAHVDGVLWRQLVVPVEDGDSDGTGWVEAAALTETPRPPTTEPTPSS